jgi:hypothetical protein
MPIEIHTRDLERPYRVLGPITARVTSGSGFLNARTLEDADSKLREEVLAQYPQANAVINVTYERYASLASWKTLAAHGTAVVADSDERTCPYCAERVKRAALVCRCCGRDLPAVRPLPLPVVRPLPAPLPPPVVALLA